MLLRPARTEQLAQLARQIHDGNISRRAFIGRALALGVSLSAADTIFRTYRAGAQDQAENPITVTVGGTPIAAIEPDLSNATPGGTLRFGRAEDSDNLDPGDQRWQRQHLVLHEHLRPTGAGGRRRHLAGARVGRELGHLRGRPDLHLPPAPERRLLRRHADDVGGRPLLLGPRGERSRRRPGPSPSPPSSATPMGRSRGSRLRTTRRSSSSWRSRGRRSSPTWRCSTCRSSPRRSPKDAKSVSSRSAWGPAPSRLASGIRASRCAW